MNQSIAVQIGTRIAAHARSIPFAPETQPPEE
jgi:hypothetical protein